MDGVSGSGPCPPPVCWTWALCSFYPREGLATSGGPWSAATRAELCPSVLVWPVSPVCISPLPSRPGSRVLHGSRCGSCSAVCLPVPAGRPSSAVGEALVAESHCRWGTWPAPWYLVGSPTEPPLEHLLRISVSECRLRSVIYRISNVPRTFWQLC